MDTFLLHRASWVYVSPPVIPLLNLVPYLNRMDRREQNLYGTHVASYKVVSTEHMDDAQLDPGQFALGKKKKEASPIWQRPS